MTVLGDFTTFWIKTLNKVWSLVVLRPFRHGRRVLGDAGTGKLPDRFTAQPCGQMEHTDPHDPEPLDSESSERRGLAPRVLRLAG